MTIFPISSYVAASQAGGALHAKLGAREVTKIRVAEDAAYASACGLTPRYLDLFDAPARGLRPFDPTAVADEAERLEPHLLGALLAPAEADMPDRPERPLLLCPSGIGGHIDHVAVQTVVTRNIERLLPLYRVCFYEDLHYASLLSDRLLGIRNLARALGGRELTRYGMALGDGAARKLDLIRLYRSQFADLPRTLEEFTPATRHPAPLHEAVWTVGDRDAGTA